MRISVALSGIVLDYQHLEEEIEVLAPTRFGGSR